MVELIELLLDGGQWRPAHDLYHGRTENGKAFLELPAPRLGQRAAFAFTAGTVRAEACRRELGQDCLSSYLNDAGLFASQSGALADAQRFLQAKNLMTRKAGDGENLAIGLLHLSESLLVRGHVREAVAAALESNDLATGLEQPSEIRDARVYLGVAYDLAGAVIEAERWFTEADGIQYAQGSQKRHLYSIHGTWWADFLLRTGRAQAARRLAEANRVLCQRRGWNNGVANCDWILGLCDLAGGAPDRAGPRLEAAVAVLRDGEMIPKLVDTLADLAEQRREVGLLEDAEQACDEAIGLAGPRDLVPSHARALAYRARVRADRFGVTGDSVDLARARDDADAALRLSTRSRQLPWGELDAYEANAHLDRMEGADHGWEARAARLRRELLPPGLDLDPPATVEAETKRQ